MKPAAQYLCVQLSHADRKSQTVCCSLQVRSALATELHGRVLELTVDTFGCRIVQKALEASSPASLLCSFAAVLRETADKHRLLAQSTAAIMICVSLRAVLYRHQL